MKQIIGMFVALLVMFVPAAVASHDVSQANYDYRLDHKTDLKPIPRSDVERDASDKQLDKDYLLDCKAIEKVRDRECKTDSCKDAYTKVMERLCVDAVDQAGETDRMTDKVTGRAPKKSAVAIGDVQFERIDNAAVDKPMLLIDELDVDKPAKATDKVRPERITDRVTDRISSITSWFRNLFGF